jgi:hypothetical protein
MSTMEQKFFKHVGIVSFHEEMFDIHLSMAEPLVERKNQTVFSVDNRWHYLELIRQLTSFNPIDLKIAAAKKILSTSVEENKADILSRKHAQMEFQKHSPESFEYWMKTSAWVSVKSNARGDVFHMRISTMEMPNMSFDFVKFDFSCKPGQNDKAGFAIRTITENFNEPHKIHALHHKKKR